MTDDLESVLRQLLKNVVREVATDLMEEWRAFARQQLPQSTPANGSFLLTPRDTAKRLAISERHLHALTRSGQLSCVRVGKCVRYNVETIQKWVHESESAVRPSTTKTHASREVSAALKPEATESPRLKRKHAAGQKKRGPIRERTPVTERGAPKGPQPVSKGRPQKVQSEERISPLSILLSELGIDRSSLPSITNGDLMRITGVDIATMHGWTYLNRSLPEEAMRRLKNHFHCLLKERQVGE